MFVGPSENPVARAFVEVIMAPLLAELASSSGPEEDAAEEEEPSLLVRP